MGRQFKRIASKDVVIERIFNPDAVLSYYKSSPGTKPSNGKAKALIENAKKHMSATGWTFFYIPKGINKQEIRYRSPSGRIYNSLMNACKACLDDKFQLNPCDSTPGSDKDISLMQKNQLPPVTLNQTNVQDFTNNVPSLLKSTNNVREKHAEDLVRCVPKKLARPLRNLGIFAVVAGIDTISIAKAVRIF